MKVNKLHLDEALFSDTPDKRVTDDLFDLDDVDDDFSSIDDLDDTDIPTGPQVGPTNGIADNLISLINSEWEAIRGYNDFVEVVKANLSQYNDPALANMLPVIDDIRNEENMHIGQLQELLKLISPNANSIQVGAVEGKSQFNFVNGKLQVQAYQPQTTAQASAQTNEITTDCTLCDVDDEM